MTHANNSSIEEKASSRKNTPKSISNNDIAIIGMGCRFPGQANDPYQFWENLKSGKNCITETPSSRWNSENYFSEVKNKKAKMNTKWGGYIDGFDEFDPAFFGISPREADFIDPQQRKLLEVSWEAMEDGGLKPSTLGGKTIGVFVGGFTLDYKIMQFTNPSFENLDSHTATGIMMTMLSNRISYIYNFNGPSMSVDTACSSSIVAVDLACKSLQQGDSEIALAGGVLINVAPQYTISETQGGFLSPTGSSHAFAATANGYVRSEGSGIVVLKRLEDAINDGNRIHAVIKSSAVNQDGKTNGITVPNADAQFNLMKKAYHKAGVNPGDVQYIEAHGTGTPVGDPIEAESVGRLLSLNRAHDKKCFVGSVKTNIGHTEAAAGMAGLMKVVMSMKHKKIPPHINLTEINPKIDIDSYPYDIPRELVDWPEHEGPMLAGVNSFGFGGTNAHLVLSEYIPESPCSEKESKFKLDEQQVKLFSITAKDKVSLMNNALAYIPFIEKLKTEKQLFDLAYTNNALREQHDTRVTFTFRKQDDLLEKLKIFTESDGEQGGLIAKVKHQEKASNQELHDTHKHSCAWVMTGMGPQWWAMGRELYQSEPVFKRTIDKINDEFDRQADWSLIDEWIHSDEPESKMGNTWLAQTANFALQIGLAEMWRVQGIEPSCIIGHSTGEIASFYLAGVYSLEDAVTIAIHRSRLQQLTHGMGKMLAVGIPSYDAGEYIKSHGQKVSIAAVNSPNACVIAGDEHTLDKIAAQLTEKEIFNKYLRVEVPYHSPVMDLIKDELFSCLAGIKPMKAKLPLYSSVTGYLVQGPELDAEYWWKNVRNPVLFAKAAQEIIDDGYTNFIEIGPHPVLSTAIVEVADELKKHVFICSSLKRKEPEQEYFFNSLATLYSHGFAVDWSSMFAGAVPSRFPSYQWRKDKYWYETAYHNRTRRGTSDHPLLGMKKIDTANNWETDISLEKYPYLNDHQIQDTTILPAAAYVEMAYGAMHSGWGKHQYKIHNLHIEKGIFLDDGSDPSIRFEYDENNSEFKIISCTLAESGDANDINANIERKENLENIIHATGYTSRTAIPTHNQKIDLQACQNRIGDSINQVECYESLHKHAYHYGPNFQAIQSLWASENELLAYIVLPECLNEDSRYHFHPSLFDACLQTVIFSEIVRLEDGEQLRSRLPVSISSISIDLEAPDKFWCHTQIIERNDEMIEANISLYNENNECFGEITGFVAKAIDSVASGIKSNTIDSWLYEPDFRPTEINQENTTGLQPCYLIFSDNHGVTKSLTDKLDKQGSHVCIVEYSDSSSHSEFISNDLKHASINTGDIDQITKLLNTIKQQYNEFDILHCMALDTVSFQSLNQETLQYYKENSLYTLLNIAKSILQTSLKSNLWVITNNGLAHNDHEKSISKYIDPLSASVCGLCRVLAQQELTENWGRLINFSDVDDYSDIHKTNNIIKELSNKDSEDEVLYHQGKRHTSRIKPAENLHPAFPLKLSNQGTYLVVGAFGAIGKLVCKTLINRGARRLLITSRGALPARDTWQHIDKDHRFYERIRFVQELESDGAAIITADVDVTREKELKYFLSDFEHQKHPSIRGVFYCAGIVKDAILSKIETNEFDDVYDTKTVGAITLHNCLKDRDIEHFVLFSSIAAQVTTAGQVSYAAGNAFLDALCQQRKQQGLNALSINWGPWAIGMIKELNLIDHYKNQRGMSCIMPEAGMKVMERILDQPHGQLAVCDANWSKVSQWYLKTPSIFSDLKEASNDVVNADEMKFVDSYIAIDIEHREQFVCDNFRRIIAEVLRCDIEQIAPEDSLLNIGVDSLMGAELGNRVNAFFGNTLSLVKLIGKGSIADLARELNEKIAQDKNTLITEGKNNTLENNEISTKYPAEEESNPFANIEVEQEYPLSYGQKAIWFTHQLNPSSAAYNIGGVMHIPSELNIEALHSAIRDVVKKHPALRTNFFVVDGEPVQRVFATRENTFEVIDVLDQSWEEIKNLAILENKQPFNLESEPLYRIRIYRQNNQSFFFAISIYHIISDAWSNYMLLNDIQEFYSLHTKNQETNIQPSQTTYYDFVQWENKLVNSIRGSSMYKFWRNQLPDEIPQLELPLDKKRPKVMTNNGESFTFEIDKALTQKIKTLSQQEGATMFMSLLGIYYMLLHRYSQQNDIIIGSPVAGRTTSDFSDVYGYFVNPLPLHQNLADKPNFLQLLSRVKSSALAALENQEFPFSLLVDRLALQHDPSRSSVFQAMFVLLNHQVDRSNMDENNVAQYKGFPMRLLEMPEEEGQFDLTLSVYEENGVYHCSFKYNCDLFYASTIKNMANHFLQLAKQAVAQPQVAITDYDMLSDGEKSHLLEELSSLKENQQQQSLTLIHSQFEQHAERSPDSIAISYQEEGKDVEQITYRELNQKANQLAFFLLESGFLSKSDGINSIALLQPKSIELIIGLLGVLKAGGSYLILDPAQPQERLLSMLSDAEATHIIHTQDFENEAISIVETQESSTGISITRLNYSDLEVKHYSNQNPALDITLDYPAYTVFTSGSTGKPKGVLVSHENISSINSAWQNSYKLTPSDVHLQMANIGFDVFCGDWVRALCSGGNLTLCDKNTLLNIPRLFDVIKDDAITIAEFVPTVLRRLLDHVEEQEEKIETINTLIVGSESWNLSDYQRMKKLTGSSTRIINSYGTSETSVDNTFFDLSEIDKNCYPDMEETGGIPIGKPFSNSHILILDDNQRPTAIGMIGEMYIGGQGVAKQYLNNPALTEERFLSLEPFKNDKTVQITTDRFYRTGDLAKWDHNGNIHLCGRGDSQVKIRGHRIELQEIESVLENDNHVSEALVTVCQDSNKQQAIFAYYQTVANNLLSEEELTHHLKSVASKSLPSFMIPNFFIKIQTLPLLANGKIDLKSLPKPEINHIKKDIVPPENWYQKEMAVIWSEMLGTNNISLYDDFFEMGGNSLYLIELNLKINQRFNIKMNVSDLFRLSTLAGMASSVEDVVTGKTQGGLPYISYNKQSNRDTDQNNNQAHIKRLFSFPPAGGYSIVYKAIAESMPDTNIISFNYLMEENKLDLYADMILSIQPEGPYQLFGYSLGGNLAFEVGKTLEKRGHVVENVIIMDSYRITDTVEITEKHLDEFRQELKGHMEKHTGSNEVQSHTMEQANNYIDFSYKQKNIGLLHAPVHYVVEKNENDPNRVHKLSSWNDSSEKGTQVYIGACDHENMLIGEHAKTHGKIINGILSSNNLDKKADSSIKPGISDDVTEKEAFIQ